MQVFRTRRPFPAGYRNWLYMYPQYPETYTAIELDSRDHCARISLISSPSYAIGACEPFNTSGRALHLALHIEAPFRTPIYYGHIFFDIQIRFRYISSQESDFLSPVRKKHSEYKYPDAIPFSVWFTTPAWNSCRPMVFFDWTRHMNKPLRKTGFSESHGYNDAVIKTDELVGRYRGTEGLTVTPDQSRRGIREGIDTRIMIFCTSPSPLSAGVRPHNLPFKTPASQKERFEKNPHITVR